MKKLKTSLLCICAFVLTCCVTLLILTATNAKALDKFNHYIMYVSNQISEGHFQISDNALAKATETNDKVASKTPKQSEHYTPIASTMSEEDVQDKVERADLPDFNVALEAAQQKVNEDNQKQNTYNDYGLYCDTDTHNTYKYIFSFENEQKPGSYYRVTVDKKQHVQIIDTDYQGAKQQNTEPPKISHQEMEVIAKSYMQSKYKDGFEIRGTRYTKEGVNYMCHAHASDTNVNLLVTHEGQVISKQ